MSNEQWNVRRLKVDFRFWQRVCFSQLFILHCSLLTANAQVPNDDIEQRRVLRVNEPATSTTTGCTVQWTCVDEKLTGKCIEYHNDQWFEFTPSTSGRYYVNIGGQKCRDTRGVQLVVLTGTPCQPATYRVLSCTSLGSQDDVFVTLDSLQAGQPYLLDVDGYLKDFCQFALTISRQPQGRPAAAEPPLSSVVPTAARAVQLHWVLPDSVGSTTRFRVLRREAAQFRSQELTALEVSRTSYGGSGQSYSYTDTLTAPGRYLYQIIAEAPNNAPPLLLQQQWVAYVQRMPTATKQAAAAKRDSRTMVQWQRRQHQARLKHLSTTERRK